MGRRHRIDLRKVTVFIRTEDYYWLRKAARRTGSYYQVLLREAVQQWCERDQKARATVL